MERRFGIVLPHWDAHVLPFGQDQVALRDEIRKLIEPQSVQQGDGRFPSDPIRPLSIHIWVQVAAVVEESVIVRFHIFPGPILGSQLAIGAIFARNVIPRIVVQKARKVLPCQGRANLDGDQQRVLRHRRRPVAADKQLDFRHRSPLLPAHGKLLLL